MENQENKLIISPKTKVYALLQAYPQLEEVLIGYVPTFEKLKNPVLRNTVAKVATLHQAAAIGNVKIEDLINVLRKAVGQEQMDILEAENYNFKKPDWFDTSKIVNRLDVGEILAAGEHPVNQVMADLNNLKQADIYELIAPFLTAPLIDKASSVGFLHWIKKEREDLFYIYFKQK